MRRILPALVAAVAISLVFVGRAGAQEWRPPTRGMPAMPQTSEVSESWMSSNSGWFAEAAGVAGVDASQLRVASEGRQRGGQAQVVRVSVGPLPVVVWQDRNGDSRSDLIEIFKSGGVVRQVIDADYDGNANVLRVYDASGTLVREERM